jgi:hypothetical protein
MNEINHNLRSIINDIVRNESNLDKQVDALKEFATNNPLISNATILEVYIEIRTSALKDAESWRKISLQKVYYIKLILQFIINLQH